MKPTIRAINESALRCVATSNEIMRIAQDMIHAAEDYPEHKKKINDWSTILMSAAASITLSNVSIVAQLAGLADGELIITSEKGH